MFDGLSFALVCLVCYGRCIGPSGQDGRAGTSRRSGETRRRGRIGRSTEVRRAVGRRDGRWRWRSVRALVTVDLVRASRVAELSRVGVRSSRARRGRSCATVRPVRRLRRWYSSRERQNARKRGRKKREKRAEKTDRRERSSWRSIELVTSRDTNIAGHRRSAVLRGAERTTSLALRRAIRSDPVSCAPVSPTPPPRRWQISPSPHRTLDRARSLAPRSRERTAPASVARVPSRGDQWFQECDSARPRGRSVGRYARRASFLAGRADGDGCREPSSRRRVTVKKEVKRVET